MIPLTHPDFHVSIITHLELNSFEKDKERGASVILHVVIHGQRQPVGHHLLHNRLCSSQHQLRMFGIERFLN